MPEKLVVHYLLMVCLHNFQHHDLDVHIVLIKLKSLLTLILQQYPLLGRRNESVHRNLICYLQVEWQLVQLVVFPSEKLPKAVFSHISPPYRADLTHKIGI